MRSTIPSSPLLPASKRLQWFFLAAIPSLLTVAFALIYLMPKPISGLSSIMPLLPLMPVFYWGMLSSRAIPYWFLFALGMVMDAAAGLPFLSPLLYMLFAALIHTQRKYIYKEGFIIKWGYFAILLLCITMANWGVLSWLSPQIMPVSPPLVQWGLTVAFYPLAYLLFDLFDRYMHDRRWQIMHGN